MAKIYYARLDEFWTKEQKLAFLEEKEHIGNIEWEEITPDEKHNWLTQGMESDFESFMPLGSKKAKKSKGKNIQTIFKTFSTGISTNRDFIAYDFDKSRLAARIRQFCHDYNEEIHRYAQKGRPKDIDAFVNYDKIKWSRNLKRHFKNGDLADYDESNIRMGLYRPFAKRYLYFADIVVDELGMNPKIFPDIETESENRIICVSGVGSNKPFQALITNSLSSLDILEKTQCFPFYVYKEDGTNRQENITDWALGQFRARYGDDGIGKRDVFHHVYALLHHPGYREKYAANLKRELPRIPFLKSSSRKGRRELFRTFAEAGKQLAHLHVHYEEQEEYPLERVENSAVPLYWRVEKMKLSKDKAQIVYNDFLTLEGVPAQAFEYRLGNRSALEWVIDQYRVKTDKRSGVTNDPNRLDDEKHIVRLVGKVITVSLETVRIVNKLPETDFEN